MAGLDWGWQGGSKVSCMNEIERDLEGQGSVGPRETGRENGGAFTTKGAAAGNV